MEKSDVGVAFDSGVQHVTACRLCDSPDLDLVVSFTPTPPGDQYVTADRHLEEQPTYPLDVMCCRGCGAVQLAHTVDPKLIYPEYLYTTSVSKGLDRHFDDYARSVMERLRPGAGALVVDIGSNDGTLLKAFKKRNCRVVGVEPAPHIAEMSAKSGIHTYPIWFTSGIAEAIQSEQGSADIITANHIMANVADLHDFIRGVKHLLAKDGTFVFETGYWPAIVKKRLIDTIEHEHIHYFAAGPLRRFFLKHGLELVHAEVNAAKGGSLRGYVKHVQNRGFMSVDCVRFLEDEFTQPVDIWAQELKDLEQRIKAVVAQSDNEIWVGYGAAVGSTLQIYQFGLAEKLICLVDDNPAKRDRLSPGKHLRVTGPDMLRTLNPDRIVILAWRYADLIMAQHPEFTGKWLIPLPELRTA